MWVTGKPPKGRGFNFDINSRLDSKRWVEVSGVVKWDRGLVSIVAEEIQETAAGRGGARAGDRRAESNHPRSCSARRRWTRRTSR